MPQESRPFTRMRRLTTLGAVIAVSAGGLTQLAVSAEPWWHVLIQLPAVAVATWAASRWQTGLTARQLIPAMAIGLIIWIAGLILGLGPLSLVGFVIPAAVTIASRRGSIVRDSLLLLVFVTASCLMLLITDPPLFTIYLVPALTYTLLFLSVFWLNTVTWRLFSELETMRKTETELAVVRERFRFASDLHDIQGHTLHVIKLKAAVAAKLQHTDPERTAAELADIQRLTAETIEQARDLANSTHSLTFASELANAEALLDAASIRVTVERIGDVPTAHDGSFALVLREATTNILRHTRATGVDIQVEPEGLHITNDGVKKKAGPPQGLATLQTRIADAGGTLDIEREGTSFGLRLRFARQVA